MQKLLKRRGLPIGVAQQESLLILGLAVMGDLFYPAWTEGGKVIGAVWGWQGSMWRYKPTN